LQVLGLKAGASKAEIIAAHRKLISKVHPDKGGSDFLAAQINLAKQILLQT
jgi:DnaJ-class molecular chaperone